MYLRPLALSRGLGAITDIVLPTTHAAPISLEPLPIPWGDTGGDMFATLPTGYSTPSPYNPPETSIFSTQNILIGGAAVLALLLVTKKRGRR